MWKIINVQKKQTDTFRCDTAASHFVRRPTKMDNVTISEITELFPTTPSLTIFVRPRDQLGRETWNSSLVTWYRYTLTKTSVRPGGSPRKIGWGCASHFPSPYPIYDTNLWFSHNRIQEECKNHTLYFLVSPGSARHILQNAELLICWSSHCRWLKRRCCDQRTSFCSWYGVQRTRAVIWEKYFSAIFPHFSPCPGQ